MITKHWKYLLWIIIGGCFLYSCDEKVGDMLPADGNIAYVNFVNSGEGFLYSGNENLQQGNCLFINDSISNPPFDNYNNRVNYLFTFDGDLNNSSYIRRLPLSYYSLTGDGDNGAGDVYWMGIKAGSYKFIYTSKNKTYLQYIEATLEKESYNMYYLTESPESDSAYSIVHATIERRNRKEGTVGLQIIHLSPDAGTVNVVRVNPEGSTINSSLPQNLSFGQNAYTELPIDNTKNTYERLLLRFIKANGNENLLSVSIPAESGAVYTLMFRGFLQQTARRVKKDNNNYTKVMVMPDLRASVRRVFN